MYLLARLGLSVLRKSVHLVSSTGLGLYSFTQGTVFLKTDHVAGK